MEAVPLCKGDLVLLPSSSSSAASHAQLCLVSKISASIHLLPCRTDMPPPHPNLAHSHEAAAAAVVVSAAKYLQQPIPVLLSADSFIRFVVLDVRYPASYLPSGSRRTDGRQQEHDSELGTMETIFRADHGDGDGPSGSVESKSLAGNLMTCFAEFEVDPRLDLP